MFRVIRAFNGAAVGDVLPAAAFKDERRAVLMVDLRYVTRMAADLAGVPVRQLAEALNGLDADALTAALSSEERASARAIIEKRIKELQQ